MKGGFFMLKTKNISQELLRYFVQNDAFQTR